MKLRTVFFLSLLAVLLVMAVPSVLGVRNVRDVRNLAVGLQERAAEAAFVVGRFQADLERLDRYQRAHVATGDPELAARVRGTHAALESHLARLEEIGYRGAVEEVKPPVGALEAVSELTTLLMEADLRDEATTLLRLQLSDLLDIAAGSAADLAAAVDAVTAQHVANVERIASREARTTTSALLLALLVAGGLALLATRFLSRPLNQLSSAMARVADGRFQLPADLPYERSDEVGHLFRAFRSMTLQLADLERMKAEFVGIASHDLKTPVSVIRGYAELMAEELGSELDERHREILESLWREAGTLNARVEQLLEVSRIEASGLRLGLEEIKVRHFTDALIRSYRDAAAGHGIAIEASIDDSAPTFVIADPDCLRWDVFGNLFDNALRFTPRGGEILLRVTGHGGFAIMELSDSGPAIPAEAQSRIFDRYYHGAERTGRAGAGLGLPIARAGVEAHGGTIDADTPPQGGTTFRVILPIHPTVASHRPEPAA